MASRHQQRETGMTCLYQHLLLKKDIKKTLYDNSEGNTVDPFLYTITVDAIEYKDVYIKKINEKLNSEWSFDRLGFVEQAILLMACCELDLETAPKAIVIDEAITLAKKYCDDEAYKLINGVLDRL